jgi:MFS family permease
VDPQPLRRNRDFLLLQSGQLLSSAGTASSSIAYSLLVLAVTHSPAKAGLVSFARLVPMAVLALPAGLAADRWNRRRLMIASDVVRALAASALALAIVLDAVPLWTIVLVAAVDGVGTAFFSSAQTGALRSVVPTTQLPAAVAAQTGRRAAVIVAGPPLGGALFEIGRSLPFFADAASYAFSTGSLLAMRTPFQEEREPDRDSLRSRLTAGMQFLWSRPFLRVCACLFGLASFIGQGLLFAVVVLGTQDRLTGGQVGLLVASFGAAVFLGSLLSPFVRRRLPIRAVLVLELWTWPICGIFLIWPSVYVLAAGMVPTALAIPSTDSVVHGYRIAMTPDRLLGRSEAVWTTIVLAVTPFGSLVAGLLLHAVSARETVAVFAGLALVLALWGTLSPSIREAPRLDELSRSATSASPS